MSWLADGDDESDTDSVCSTRTCPDKLDYTMSTVKSTSKVPSIGQSTSKGKHQKQKPPPGVQQPPVGSTSPQTKKPVAKVKPFTEGVREKAGASASVRGYGIRKRPRLVFGAYRLCKYYRLQQPCFQGERCSYAHSEEERKAWEVERKRGRLLIMANKGLLLPRFKGFQSATSHFLLTYGILWMWSYDNRRRALANHLCSASNVTVRTKIEHSLATIQEDWEPLVRKYYDGANTGSSRHCVRCIIFHQDLLRRVGCTIGHSW